MDATKGPRFLTLQLQSNIEHVLLITYTHDRCKVVLGGGGGLLTGSPDVLDGVVKVTQLRCDRPLVHWEVNKAFIKHRHQKT